LKSLESVTSVLSHKNAVAPCAKSIIENDAADTLARFVDEEE
jgi:hypothetical protein